MTQKTELFPDFKTFCRRAGQGNLVPVYKQIIADTETPVSAFMKLQKNEYCFLLESLEGGEKWARYSFLGFNPSVIFRSKGNRVTVTEGKKQTSFDSDDPLQDLKQMMKQYQPVQVDGLPRFTGGAIGFMGYDMVRFFEPVPSSNPDDLDWYDCCFMITDTMLVFDNLKHHLTVVCNVAVNGDRDRLDFLYRGAEKKIDAIVATLSKPLKRKPVSAGGIDGVSMSSNFKKNGFKRIVEKAKDYIRSGDIIQVVLSQRFETGLQTDPFELYRSLRLINPSPYMYFLKMKDCFIVGSSPEVLVRLEQDEIILRPIAGTRPRGETEDQDLALETDLKNDPKEIAEHIMLVDLGRNDIGRVSDFGTVHVKDLMVIERYSHVMHIVSSVHGRLKKGLDGFDVLRASFPAGTVTGAPKIRAMQIIDELEKQKRGPYAGAVGYFAFSGNMDFCITIRTMLIKDGRIYIQAGAGIVADSSPENEFNETVNKAKGMFKAIQKASEGYLKCC